MSLIPQIVNNVRRTRIISQRARSAISTSSSMTAIIQESPFQVPMPIRCASAAAMQYLPELSSGGDSKSSFHASLRLLPSWAASFRRLWSFQRLEITSPVRKFSKLGFVIKGREVIGAAGLAAPILLLS
jgi:hypothetical protein